ncbi:MAG: NAD-dependent epimerase/dehydratase family protein [Deltaproteobacteria bacterium]|nr:NAD-dependent epimerase/dehydratase family protein [Deltaproteobacteria bacterium]
MTTASILITGINGFTGRHLLAALEDKGLTSIVGVGQSLFGFGPRYLPVDLRDTPKVEELLKAVQPDYIYHLVGQIRGENTPDLVRVNVVTTVNILEGVSRIYPRSKVLIIGSASEYGPHPEIDRLREDTPCLPAGSYGLSKKLQTDIALHFHRVRGVQVIIARPFNLLGPYLPNGLVARDLTQRIKNLSPEDQTLPVRGMDSVRDFLDVRDAISAYIRLMEQGDLGKIYNICSGRGRTIKEVAEHLLKIAGFSKRIRVINEGEISRDHYVGDLDLIFKIGWQSRYTFEESLKAVYSTNPIR